MLRLALTAVAVAVATEFMRLTGPRWHVANLSMLYLLLIQVAAVIGGRLVAMTAAVLSFFALNWFFLPPVGRLVVSNPDEWLVLVFFLGTGLVSGQMAAELRSRAREARERAREMATLYELGIATAGQVELDPILAFLTDRIHERFSGARCEFLLWDRSDQLRPLPMGSDPIPGPVIRFPLRSGQHDFGEMQVGRRADGTPHSAADRHLLTAVARHAALAIERARLAREAHEARLLRDSDSLKSTLLSAVSHDLRTPLAGIKALTTALLHENVVLSPELVQDALHGIDEETDRMTRLVSDLLDLSRIEAGALRSCREPVVVAELIDNTLARLAAVLADRPVRRQLPGDLLIVEMDYVQMQQVITNLVENAVRYTPSDSPITIGVQVVDDALEIWVADRGPGIPPERRERVFDRFYRLEHHETEPHGTGLGLAISRGLVRAHGGQIWVEETVGGGATFRVRLPLTSHRSCAAAGATLPAAEPAPAHRESSVSGLKAEGS